MTRLGRRAHDTRSDLRKEFAQVDEIISLASNADEIAVTAYLQSLAVIRLSGAMESSMTQMVNCFLDEHTNHRVLSFSKHQARKLKSMNASNLEELVGSFDKNWRTELSAFLEKDENRNSLNNLIGARHALAHGGGARISSSLVREYREVAKETVSILQEMFVPIR
jgi:hypothetical protein